jgi:hypothetical protein
MVQLEESEEKDTRLNDYAMQANDTVLFHHAAQHNTIKPTKEINRIRVEINIPPPSRVEYFVPYPKIAFWR